MRPIMYRQKGARMHRRAMHVCPQTARVCVHPVSAIERARVPINVDSPLARLVSLI